MSDQPSPTTRCARCGDPEVVIFVDDQGICGRCWQKVKSEPDRLRDTAEFFDRIRADLAAEGIAIKAGDWLIVPDDNQPAPPTTCCARCGEAEVSGAREDEPICPGCLFEMLGEAYREIAALRGAARAYLDARDRVDHAGEREAKARLEAMLPTPPGVRVG
jgi:hypothetical protein